MCTVIVASCPVVVPVESLHSCSWNCELVLFCGSSMPPFEKKCPECGNTVHVRKLSCSCGYGFSRTSKRCLTSKNSIKQSVEANDKRKKANVACQTRKRVLLTYQESQQCRQTNASCMALKRSLDSEKSQKSIDNLIPPVMPTKEPLKQTMSQKNVDKLMPPVMPTKEPLKLLNSLNGVKWLIELLQPTRDAVKEVMLFLCSM